MRHQRQIQMEQPHIQPLSRRNKPLEVGIRDGGKAVPEEGQIAGIIQRVDRDQLTAHPQLRYAHQRRGGVLQAAADIRREVEHMLHGMVDHLDHAQHQQNLNEQRDHTQHGTIAFPLIQLHAVIGNGVPVAEILQVDPVQFRLKPDHLDGVFLDNHIQRKQDHLRQQGEQHNGKDISPCDPVTQPHQPSQGSAEDSIDQRHKYLRNQPLCFTGKTVEILQGAGCFYMDTVTFVLYHVLHTISTQFIQDYDRYGYTARNAAKSFGLRQFRAAFLHCAGVRFAKILFAFHVFPVIILFVFCVSPGTAFLRPCIASGSHWNEEL